MADIEEEHRGTENEEEYVMLNLDEVVDKVSIPPNAPYVLSGLDTLNPILIIDNRLKLIGEYDETIGTCYVFSEQDDAHVVHEETGPSETNLFSGVCIIDSNQPTTKQVRPISSLHKIIRFRIFENTDVIPGTTF
uniref:Transcription factor TFIIIC triple barrel domain-containing protein n=1 Tax=Kalanchoe fedtschenkoi TaxID=63787 RepID=A0A7N1A523_KALFE